MYLEDCLADYVSVFPNGSLDYLKYNIKKISDIDLNIFKAEAQKNIKHYESIYMNKFLYVIYNEYEDRLKVPKKNQLSINASEFVPVYFIPT